MKKDNRLYRMIRRVGACSERAMKYSGLSPQEAWTVASVDDKRWFMNKFGGVDPYYLAPGRKSIKCWCCDIGERGFNNRFPKLPPQLAKLFRVKTKR